MKMQELIGEFRDETPKLVAATDVARRSAMRMKALFDDFDRCSSQEAKDALVEAVRTAMREFSSAFTDAKVGVERLAKLNAEYTRVLGPRKKAAKENPNQMKLPLEGV